MSHCPSDGLKFNFLRFYVLGNEFSALILSVLTKIYKRLDIFNSLELVFWTYTNHFMGSNHFKKTQLNMPIISLTRF